MDEETARNIFKKNFIGSQELIAVADKLKIASDFSKTIPKINLDLETAQKICKDFILVLGVPEDCSGNKLTINRLREIFGIDPNIFEPCFYNQDWYLKEKFASKETLKFKWYLIRKNVEEQFSGKEPGFIEQKIQSPQQFPSAILAAFTFFAFYFINGKTLWEHDFIWCRDHDANEDRIYVGRYKDKKGINKNGFNIHRHLSIKPNYGYASEIKI